MFPRADDRVHLVPYQRTFALFRRPAPPLAAFRLLTVGQGYAVVAETEKIAEGIDEAEQR